MAKAELGVKLTCESCGARFYDLNKSPGVCPKCGTANERPVIFETSRRPVETPEPKKAAPPKKDDDDLDDMVDDDDDEDVIEDTSDLGDDDDVDVVVEKDGD